MRLAGSGFAVCGEMREAESAFKDILLMRISEIGTTEWALRIGDSLAD